MRFLIASLLSLLLLSACNNGADSSAKTSAQEGNTLIVEATPMKTTLMEIEPLVVSFRFYNPTDSTMGLKIPTVKGWDIKVDGYAIDLRAFPNIPKEYFLLPAKQDTVFSMDWPGDKLWVQGTLLGDHELRFDYLHQDGGSIAVSPFKVTVEEMTDSEIAAAAAYDVIKMAPSEDVEKLADQFLEFYPASVLTNHVKLRKAGTLLYDAKRQDLCQQLLDEVYYNNPIRSEQVDAATYLAHIYNRNQNYRKMYELWRPLDPHKAKRFKKLADAMGQ
ncbi:MAG: hypothetical protein AAGG75_22540 [Bacteroidota bacterium]